jgi:hypothetical protein
MGAPHEQSARRRGLLALLNEPLAYYPYNPELLQQTTHAMRRRGRFKPTVSFTVEGIPSDSEWTLFFLADAKHLNSLRFRPILTDFIQQSHSECTCICIPNHEDNQDLLCGGTGFSCLSWSHPNRAALLQLLSVSEVPSVIVIENATGRRLTDKGMIAIESNDAQELLKRWRRQETGQTWTQTIQSGCCIS